MGTPREECSRVITGIYGLVTEAWGQGFVVGGLGILLLLTVASMRGGVVLHKLIIAELFMASIHTTFIFVNGPAAGWYTSVTAIFLYVSYNLHNIINWIKVKPFLSRHGSLLYICTIILAGPYWVVETYFNFAYNNDRPGGNWFPKFRPWEALCREPWWLFTSFYLIFTIKRSYSCSVLRLVQTSGKFGVLMFSMSASIAFIFADIITIVTLSSPCAGENPFWKIALVFKCTADAIFLDDFKSVLDKLSTLLMDEIENRDFRLPQPAIQNSARVGRREEDEVGSLHQTLGGSRHCSSCTCHLNRSNKDSTQHLELSVTENSLQKAKTKEWFDVIDPL